MRAIPPLVEVPGDNKEPILLGEYGEMEIRPRIMARSGDCLGMSRDLAVWRFGFSIGSEAAAAYGVYDHEDGFLWVLATRRTGLIKETFRGFATNLPPQYLTVMGWEPK